MKLGDDVPRPPLLELREVRVTYGDRKHQVNALERIDLTVEDGEFVALLGPTGCGKSTLLRIVTGLQAPSAGTVLYRGVPLSGVNPHATIVFQTLALFPWLTVQENVEVVLQARGMGPERTRRARELLDRVGLDGFENAYPRELSRGMLQKVSFARAMAVEPELLCLDEPFSALDPLSAEALRGELLELWLGDKIPARAILLVTHSIEEAVLMADRIVVMVKDPGRILASLRVALPRPRDRKSIGFIKVVDYVYAALAGQTQPEALELGTAPGSPGQTRWLPYVEIDALSGFLEHLAAARGQRADIYHLSGELETDSDRVLSLTDAAELLGFATVAQGDITLTPLGWTFAEASILERKVIFAGQLRRIPLFRWLLAMLQAAEEHQLERSVLQAALAQELPEQEAARQVDVALGWGRYAELLEYDDDREVIRL